MSDLPFSLDVIDVATPCHAPWEEMQGDDRVRHCAACQKNVYNLSAMTRPEAEALVQRREGRMCIRFFRRTDGTLLTADCPVGLLAAARRRLAGWFAAAAAAVLALFTVGSAITRGAPTRSPGIISQPPMMRAVAGEMVCPTVPAPVPAPAARQRAIQGDMWTKP